MLELGAFKYKNQKQFFWGMWFAPVQIGIMLSLGSSQSCAGPNYALQGLSSYTGSYESQ